MLPGGIARPGGKVSNMERVNPPEIELEWAVDPNLGVYIGRRLGGSTEKVDAIILRTMGKWFVIVMRGSLPYMHITDYSSKENAQQAARRLVAWKGNKQ